MNALKEKENGDPLIKQRILEMVKASIKTDSLKHLYKIVGNMSDIEDIIYAIENYCRSQNHILNDFKERINKLKTPKTKLTMYGNCKMIADLIAHIQGKEMTKNITPSIFTAMVEKAFHPISFLP